MPPLQVSVLIDTYNHESYIEQAIVSVLEQDFLDAKTEILVVDDGSTDRTAEIVRRFEPRVRLIEKSNGGQASAFNAAIPEARGEIIAFLDGDDWWAKEKLSAVVDAFEKHPHVAAVGHGYYEVYDNNPPTEMVVAKKTCYIDVSSDEAAAIANLGRTLLGTSRLAVRRRVLDRIGPIPAALIFCADAPILTLSLALGGAIILDRPLCYYRLHAGSLFTHSSIDPAKSLRKAEMLAITVDYLRPRLKSLGVPAEACSSVLEAYQIEIDRLELNFGQRGRWKSLRVEMRDFKASYRKASIRYRLFKALVAVLAFTLPPRRFYEIRSWYSRKNLKRFRIEFVAAEPSASLDLFQRRPVAGPN
jgi:glycosyltransferase involved in cell wall biosynthesis